VEDRTTGDSPLERARALRRSSTDAESRLWRLLRDRSLGVKFRRQFPFGRYILDFYCLEYRLVVEVDGGQHFEPAGMAADAERTRILEASGLKVLRFTNREVLLETDDVAEAIREAVQGEAEESGQ
jgi:very-short-patch-repair endonuclease